MMAAYPVTDMYKQSSGFGESGVFFFERRKSLMQALRLNAVAIQRHSLSKVRLPKATILKRHVGLRDEAHVRL
jgi:hypothetical protein